MFGRHSENPTLVSSRALLSVSFRFLWYIHEYLCTTGEGIVMLEQYGVPRTYKNGEVIFRQGQFGQEMYVIRSGKVRIFGTHNGAETTFAVLREKDFLGEMSLLTGEPRSATAKAQGDVSVSVIDAATFAHLISEPLVHDILTRMSRRLQDVDIELEKLGSQDTIRREHLGHLIEQRHWLT
jgi:CRP-like cAMP-binding protein